MRFRPLPVAGAAVLAATALLITAGPAQASITVTAKPSTTHPVVGSALTVSGAISGNGVRRVYQQHASGGHWYNDQSVVPYGGHYSFTLRRTNYGSVAYRVTAVNSAGSQVAASPTVRLAWFKWLTLGTAAQKTTTQTGGNEHDSVQWLDTQSFGGASWANSMTASGWSTSAGPFGMDFVVHVHSACTQLRYAVGFSGENAGYNANATGTVELLVDGTGIRSNQFSNSAPVTSFLYSAISGHDELSLDLTTTDSGDGKPALAVIATPQVLCKAAI